MYVFILKIIKKSIEFHCGNFIPKPHYLFIYLGVSVGIIGL